jgi:hypothetical protein
MLVTKTKLESAWAKIERAKYHFEQLQFNFSRHPHSEGFVFDNDLQARQHVFTYTAPRRRFIDYAILCGETISQARTALEHAVYALDPSPDPLYNGFPVVLDSTEYRNKGRPKVKRLDAQARAIIKGLQPFNNGGKCSPLWILHDMWNTDKHKLLHIVAADFGGLARNYYREGRFIQRTTGLPGKLKDGAEFRIDFPDFYEPTKVHVDVEVMLRLEFDTRPGQLIDTLLAQLIDFAEGVVRDLEKTLP